MASSYGFNDLANRDQAWSAYEARHREPTDEDAWQKWRDVGPRLRTPTARALASMSGGELRILRVNITLSSSGRVRQGWQISDFDARGAAVVEDWIAGLRARHPELSQPRPDVQGRAERPWPTPTQRQGAAPTITGAISAPPLDEESPSYSTGEMTKPLPVTELLGDLGE